MLNSIDNISGSIESQIVYLKSKIASYAHRLAPVPKISKLDTSRNGECTSNVNVSKERCDICNSKVNSLFYWTSYDYDPNSKKIKLLNPQDVCILCLNILDVNILMKSLIKSENDDENSLLYSHFLNVNKINPINQVYLQHCISMSFAIQVLSK